MITEDSFARLMHELGDVDAPPIDARLSGIQTKIKRVRIRRALTAAVAVIAIVAAGIAFAVLPIGPPAIPASVPRSWTADDGVIYKLVKYVTMDTGHQTSLSIDVPATSPITIRFTCAAESPDPNEPLSRNFPAVDIGRGVSPLGPQDQQMDLSCRNGTKPTLADYDPRQLSATNGIARLVVNGEKATIGGLAKVYPARWTFAIYAWVRPKTLRPVSTLAPMPTVSGNRLQTTFPINWPRQPSVTFHVPANITWGIAIGCSDALRGSSPVAVTFAATSLATGKYVMTINGKGEQNSGTVLDCQPVAPAELQGDGIEGPDAVPSTVTVTFSLPPIYNDRIDVLQVGLYYATS